MTGEKKVAYGDRIKVQDTDRSSSGGYLEGQDLFRHEEGLEVCLDARYYDTCHCDLSKKQIAYRIRKEGERWVAALKCNGTNEGALHKRIEISVPVIDGTPDP